MSATSPKDSATPERVSSSGVDSTLICMTPALSASAISPGVLPTPEKTIFDAGTPATKARFISPPETTSAPAPSLASAAITAILALALTA